MTVSPITSAAAAFRSLSRWRGARVFHPHGVTATGTLTVLGSGVEGTTLLVEGGQSPVCVRLSKGIGLAGATPDILGVAIRVPDAYGPGAPQDLLLATTLPVLGARALLAPRRSFDSAAFSSILPYRIGGRLHLFGAVVSASRGRLQTLDHVAAAARTGDLHVRLRIAPPLRGWRDVAAIHLTDAVDPTEGESLRYAPQHTGGGIEPAGPLQGLRTAAYPASQEGRPDT